MKRKYVQIDRAERRRIEHLLEAGESIRGIAKKLGRSPSAVKYELGRNKVKGNYDSRKASHKAYVRRHGAKRDCLVVARSSELMRYVRDRMENHDESPELISGRLESVDTHLPYASTKAIYKYLRSTYGKHLRKLLYMKSVGKKSGIKRDKSNKWKDGRVNISKRPKRVEKRLEFGHFEGDFIESGKGGRGSLLVLVERKTRYPFIAYLEDKGTKNVNRLMSEMLSDTPVRSITLDNDISFQKHEELSELLQALVFFCDPYSSWQKGSVENRNRAIRRYVKRKSDISSYPRDFFPVVEDRLRNRAMKCLGFRTPQEAWDIEMKEEAKRDERSCVKIGSSDLDLILKVKSEVF